MTSESKRNANKKNARKSTGPHDTSRTRFNALKHGLFSGQMVIQGPEVQEDASAFDELLEALYREKRPVGILEEFMVDAIAGYTWRLRRVWRYESADIATSMEDARGKIKIADDAPSEPYSIVALVDPGTLIPSQMSMERVSRSETHYHNLLSRTLRELERLQKVRSAEEFNANQDTNESENPSTKGNKAPDQPAESSTNGKRNGHSG